MATNAQKEQQDMKIEVAASQGHKCPRCWHYHHAPNYDNLCDRCCDVMVSSYPDHELVPHIVESMEAQLKKWGLPAGIWVKKLEEAKKSMV